MTFAEHLKKMRLEKGLTQNQIAKKAGISRVAVGNYERGDRQPNLETSRKIADALGVPVADLAGWSYFDELYPGMADEVKLLEQISSRYGSDATNLLDVYSHLNSEGKAKALDAVSDLSLIPKYQKK